MRDKERVGGEKGGRELTKEEEKERERLFKAALGDRVGLLSFSPSGPESHG